MKKTIRSLISCLLVCVLLTSIVCVSASGASSSNAIYLLGDVDKDGVISITDATKVQLGLVGLTALDETELYLANVDGDVGLSIRDVTYIQKYLVGIIPDLAVNADGYKIGDKVAFGDEQKEFTVVFKDYDGAILSSQNVPEGGTANLPDAPTKSGQTFLGWSGTYFGVNKDETVEAIYSDDKNVFMVESVSGGLNDTVTVLVSIDGVVKTCGFDFTLSYDSGLELLSYDSDLDLDIVANEKAVENGIVLNFSSISDKKKQRDIIELTFKIKDATKTDFPVTIDVRSIKELSGSNILNADYSVVNGLVKRK